MNDEQRQALKEAGTDEHLQQDIDLQTHQPEPEKTERRGGFRANAGKHNQRSASRHVSAALPMIKALITIGESLGKIAQKMNSNGYRTQQGKLYTRTHVYRICQRENLKR